MEKESRPKEEEGSLSCEEGDKLSRDEGPIYVKHESADCIGSRDGECLSSTPVAHQKTEYLLFEVMITLSGEFFCATRSLD